MHTALGGVDVVLCGSAVASVASFTAAGSLSLLDGHFARLSTDDGWLLVLDHRDAATVESMAYIECWRPAARVEGDLSALIVLCDAPPEVVDKPDLPGQYTLAELARVLRMA